LATGDGSVAANTVTNQLGELFYTDCGNSIGTSSVLNKARRNCTALSALSSVIGSPQILFSGSEYLPLAGQGYWWVYQTPNSSQQPWNNDTNFNGMVGTGDALAVRAAPEVDPASAASGLALLFGCLAVLRGRRTARSAEAIH
jgi:hypothetical protein